MIRWGVLGLGKIARTRFLPALEAVPEAKLAAVGSRQPEEAVRGMLPLTAMPKILSYEALVAAGRSLADAVYIALPNDLHEEWVLRCAEAGLHVLCEKPLSDSHAAALRCRQRCMAQGVLLAEGFMYRYDPRHRRVQELIDAGAIGRASLIEATFSYILEDLQNIRLRPERLGGALMDIGCYGIDLARFLFREEPVEVSARALWGERSGVDELTALALLFPSGRLATVTVSTHLARYHNYRVRGSEGMITVPNAFIPRDNEVGYIELDAVGCEPRREEFPPCAPFVAELEQFCRAVRARDATLLAPLEDGVANAWVLEAARRALNEGQRCTLPWTSRGR
jgi:xylose dehydrogenase (NAD/NADP)